MTFRNALYAAVAIGATLVGAQARAQVPPPLTVSDFTVDLYQGAVLGSGRVIGLGGAYSAVAEGTAGIPYNPAAVAQRSYYSTGWFDWDYALDLLITGIHGGDVDVGNSGATASNTAISLVLGGHLQFGALGVGVYWRLQDNDFESAGEEFDLLANIVQVSVGYGFFRNQLVFGGGVRLPVLSLKRDDSRDRLFREVAIGGEAGVLLRPERLPIRLGVSLSSAASSGTARECGSSQCPDGFVMPRRIALPWELRLGAAYRLSFGSRPFNPVPGYLSGTKPPDDETFDFERDYRGERYLLLTAELGLIGSVAEGVSPGAFARQVRIDSGSKLVASPRFGIESEILRRRLRLRAGGYWEPGRTAAESGRMHGTIGFDLRVFDETALDPFYTKVDRFFRGALRFLFGRWSLLLSASADIAQRYSNMALSIGLWH